MKKNHVIEKVFTIHKLERIMCWIGRIKLNKAIAHMFALGIYNKSNTNNFSNIAEVIDDMKYFSLRREIGNKENILNNTLRSLLCLCNLCSKLCDLCNTWALEDGKMQKSDQKYANFQAFAQPSLLR